MARRNQPAKQPKAEPKLFSFSGLADRIKTWHIVMTAALALLGAGWWAKARAGEFATKAEMSAAQLDIQAHNAELAAIHQALLDIRWDVQQLLPKK